VSRVGRVGLLVAVTSLAVASALALVGGGALVVRGLLDLDGSASEAWALFEADRAEPEGSSGYAALWCLAYDVPEDEREAVLQGEDQRLRAFGSDRERARGRATSKKLEGYPLIAPREGEDPPLFDGFEPMRARMEDYRRMYERDEPLLERVASLGDYDHMRSIGPDLGIPVQSILAFVRAPTLHAYEFTSGRVDAALDGTCRGLSTARMLSKTGDRLWVGMTAQRVAKQFARVLADALAEVSVSRPLPPSCAGALALPSTEETSHCPELHGEIEALIALLGPLERRLRDDGGFLFDPRKTKDRLVAAYAGPCGARAREALDGDSRTEFASPPDWLVRLSCLGNAVGCAVEMLHPIDRHADLGRKKQDVGALLRMLSAIAWLRAHTREDESWEARLGKLPAELHTPSRAIRLGEDGASLVMERYENHEGGPLTLPLPGTRVRAATE
jgi:hypothetical protein